MKSFESVATLLGDDFVEYYAEHHLTNYKTDTTDFTGPLLLSLLDLIPNIVTARGLGALRFLLYKRYIEVFLNCSE